MMLNWLKLIIAAMTLATLVWAGEDRGIGGTGKWLGADEERGLGGTGVIGTLTQFGSIWVNGLEIELNDQTHITLDGHPATESDLRLGQQVKVLALPNPEGSHYLWHAQQVLVDHAVIGTVSQLNGDEIWVQGVKIVSDPNRPGEWPSLAIGDGVRVSGYFHQDTLFATDLQTAPVEQWQISAPVTRNPWGQWQIAGLPLPDDVLEAQEGETLTLRGELDQVRFIRHDDGIPFAKEAVDYVIERRSPERSETIHINNHRPDKSGVSVKGGRDIPTSMYELMRNVIPNHSAMDKTHADGQNQLPRARFERQFKPLTPDSGSSSSKNRDSFPNAGNVNHSGQSSSSNERVAPSRNDSRSPSSGPSATNRDRGSSSASHNGRGEPPNRRH